MKKTFEMFGLAILICFSFLLTDKTTTVIKEKDVLMTTIKEKSSLLEEKSINAKIEDDEIIPGVTGKIVDIDKSYQTMKKIGIYQDKWLVYKEVKPVISLDKNYDKYVVGGNPKEKKVSFIFKAEKDAVIEPVLALLKEKNIKANFFIDSNWLEHNIGILKDITNDNHVVGSLGYLKSYSNENSYWLDSNIKRATNQEKYYCYCEEKDSTILNYCSKNEEYTILPQMVISKDLLMGVSKNIKSGSIISIVINKNTLQELSNTLDYVISKGYVVVNLDKLLKE